MNYKIQISNHPSFSEVERYYEIGEVILRDSGFAVSGFVRYYLNNTTPKGFSAQGDYYALVAGDLMVDNMGNYTDVIEDQVATEFEYYMNIPTDLLLSDLADRLNIPKENVTLENVLDLLIGNAILKQDALKRFD